MLVPVQLDEHYPLEEGALLTSEVQRQHHHRCPSRHLLTYPQPGLVLQLRFEVVFGSAHHHCPKGLVLVWELHHLWLIMQVAAAAANADHVLVSLPD